MPHKARMRPNIYSWGKRKQVRDLLVQRFARVLAAFPQIMSTY